MSPDNQPRGPRRSVYMILSPRSLPYARLSLMSLFENSTESLDLNLITDSSSDKIQLLDTMHSLQPDARHRFTVTSEEELLDQEAVLFAAFPNLHAFRHGHPCWRKITDPLLLGEPGQELILLDPDLYFPNPFRFEETPASGLLLMWQRPNCLLPPEIVRSAMDQGIALADHVDIGVAHWRAGQDLAWIDWLISKLGGSSLPRAMHIEAIVWAAIAMHGGGGYLDPALWVCWHRTQLNRVKRKAGFSGIDILRPEPWNQMKCFHSGGEAKWWLPDLHATGILQPGPEHLQAGHIAPFVPFTRARFERNQSARRMLRGLGYYKLFGSS